MANRKVFQAIREALRDSSEGSLPTRNEEGAPAYRFEPRHALAQYAATGCLNTTFYASAEMQLNELIGMAARVDDEFLAKTAIYSREKGFMKDVPAVLCAVLSTRNPALSRKVFHRVIDNGKMLRTFVQVLRSGAVGRRSLGTVPKRLTQQWIAGRSDEQLFRDSVGNEPSLADVIKMVHPKPANPTREALLGYLLNRDHRPDLLPDLVQRFEAFKAGARGEVPEVPFQMLTAQNLGTAEWKSIARTAPWQMTRMNLNTFARHGVFEDATMVEQIAQRLSQPDAVRRARAFPYQLLAAYKSAGAEVPAQVREALQDAMEVATENVPQLPGRVVICPDVSGSMASPVTGFRRGSTSAVQCIDVAALVAAAIVRQNPDAEVLPFEDQVVPIRLNPRDSVMTLADQLASIGGGGTNCSAPIAELNRRGAKADLVVFVSDNQSWVDAVAGRGTATMREWDKLKRNNPTARMVCIDLQPYANSQAAESSEVLNIGGFSDEVFRVIAAFAMGGLNARHWVGLIQSVDLETEMGR